jgi:hypothetical protein
MTIVREGRTGTMAIMQVACGGLAVVLRLETPEPVPVRASVGSTEASESLLARFGVVGPKRASVDLADHNWDMRASDPRNRRSPDTSRSCESEDKNRHSTVSSSSAIRVLPSKMRRSGGIRGCPGSEAILDPPHQNPAVAARRCSLSMDCPSSWRIGPRTIISSR